MKSTIFDRQPVGAAEFQKRAEPEDPYHLTQQAVKFFLDGEEVEIPFLHANAPVEAFLENSCKWEKVGYLDNALMYALLAQKNQPNAVSANARLEELRAKLGSSYSVVEELLSKHGLSSDVADTFAKELEKAKTESSLHDAPANNEALVAMRPREGVYRLRLADSRYANRDFTTAALDYREASSLDLPTGAHVHTLVGIGNSYVEEGRTDDAVASFQSALDEAPNSVYALVNLAFASFAAIAMQRLWLL